MIKRELVAVSFADVDETRGGADGGRRHVGPNWSPVATADSHAVIGKSSLADRGGSGEDSDDKVPVRENLSAVDGTRRADSCDATASGGFDSVVFAAYGSARPGAASSIAAAFCAVEQAVAPLTCELAYTSAPVLRALDRRGEFAPALDDALERVRTSGTGRIAVQPAYLMGGWAMSDLAERVRAACGERAVLGSPLLSCVPDAAALAAALVERHPQREGAAYVFVAHGESWPQGMRPPERAGGFDALAAIRAELEGRGRTDVLVLTMADALIAAQRVRDLGSRRVRIVPLMLTAGHHVGHQLFGADPQSFSSRLASAGFEVEACDEGLFDLPAVRELFAVHARELCRI